VARVHGVFTEAIFLDISLYGRERVFPGLHLLFGVMVAGERRSASMRVFQSPPSHG